MSPAWISPRRTLAVVLTASVLAALAAGSIASLAPASAARATTAHIKAAPPAPSTFTARQVAFKDAMRSLWEAHGT